MAPLMRQDVLALASYCPLRRGWKLPRIAESPSSTHMASSQPADWLWHTALVKRGNEIYWGKRVSLDNEAQTTLSIFIFINPTTTVPLIKGICARDTWWVFQTASPYIHYVFLHTCILP